MSLVMKGMVLMRIQKDLAGRRAVLGLGLAGLLAAMVGCDSTSDVTQNTDAKNNPGLDAKKAREAAYGKAGMPTAKQSGAKK